MLGTIVPLGGLGCIAARSRRAAKFLADAGTASMSKRNLHIVNLSNPLFAICERCNARFSSFVPDAQQADQEVRAAFNQHECISTTQAQRHEGTAKKVSR